MPVLDKHPQHSSAKEAQPTLSVLDQHKSELVSGVLQPSLENLIALGCVIKQLHWNVVGPNFRPIHLHLDEIYEEVEQFSDVVAERMSTLGRSPNGTLIQVTKSAQVKDPQTGFIRDVDVLAVASDRLKVAAQAIRTQCDKVEDDDPTTADILHAVIAKLEMHHWMIEAQRL